MAGLELIEVFIDLALWYLLLASIVSALHEQIEAIAKWRAADLERALREILDDLPGTGLAKNVYEHPLIAGFYQGAFVSGAEKGRRSTANLPSYIPARSFALALLDVIGRGPVSGAPDVSTRPLTPQMIRAVAGARAGGAAYRVVLSALDSTGGDLNATRAQLEDWFNSTMDRVSGWYKRRAQKVILLLSVIVTVAVNANTLTIIERLSVDGSLRQALVERAQQTPAAPVATAGDAATADPAAQAAAQPLAALGQLGLPMGWSDGWPGARGNPLAKPAELVLGSGAWWWSQVFHPLIGLLLTALAISLGAPFWFDMMNKLISLRGALKPVAANLQGSAAQTPPPAVPPAAPASGAAQAPAFEPRQWARGNPDDGVL